MKAYFLFTASGPMLVLTSCNSIEHPRSLEILHSKGIDKFIAHEVSVEAAKEKYGAHYDMVRTDVHESDDLRVLDFNGQRAYRYWEFEELGQPIYHQPK